MKKVLLFIPIMQMEELRFGQCPVRPQGDSGRVIFGPEEKDSLDRN